MYSKLYSAALAGMDSFLVEVETDVSDGLPHVEMVGALSSETRESRERVRTALKNTGIRIPPKKITVNLAPADRRKEGTGFDLAIAVGILAALELVPWEGIQDSVIVGEVCLDGTIRSVRGVLAMADRARSEGKQRMYVPRGNAREAAVTDELEVIPVDSLEHMVAMLKDPNKRRRASVDEAWEQVTGGMDSQGLDFCQIGGQTVLKRAAEVACSGMHNLLMVGQAGTGKSMVAHRIPTILPRLTREERVRISTIYSVAGYLPPGQGLVSQRPFRSPHHTVTAAGLAGGGRIPRPGEISLAHGGVLFLDELPEFRSDVLETLRQPMEDRRLTLVRAGVSYEFPADFMLVAAMNPCRCGYYPDRNLCHCTEKEVRAYLSRISRPLLDRMDICTEVGKVAYEELHGTGETSAQIRERVERTVTIQQQRFEGTRIRCNARIPAAMLERYCPMEPQAQTLLSRAYDRMALSTRGLHSIRRVARTIADMEGKEVITKAHISEAIFYRGPRDQWWGGV